MLNSKFQSLAQGTIVTLNQQEISEFVNLCQQRSIPPEQLNKIGVAILRSSSSQSYNFLKTVEKEILSKSRYSDSFFNEPRITTYNYLTSFAISNFAKTTFDQAEPFVIQAKKYLNAAERIRVDLPCQIVLSRAFFSLYSGDLITSSKMANNLEKESQCNPGFRHIHISTLTLQAQICFTSRNYERSLDYYKKMLSLNKQLPTKARLGMAYCFFNLEKYQMAKACFQRIIKLDGNCSEAHLGLGIIYNKNEQFQQYFECLTKAYKSNKTNPLIHLHLAEHFITIQDLAKAKIFCEKGLQNLMNFTKILARSDSIRNDYYILQGRLLNVMGQIQHIKQQFDEAVKYYIAAEGRGIIWNTLALAQCYTQLKQYGEAMKIMQYLYKKLDVHKKDTRLVKDSFRLMAYLKKKFKKITNDPYTAIYYYEQAMKFDKTSIELRIELSYLFTDGQYPKSLQYLDEALKIQKDKGISPNAQNIINSGVLQIEVHEPEAAAIKLKEAIDMIQRDEILHQIDQSGLLIIALYNYAICHQHLGYNYEAKRIYERIIKMNYLHLDSHLRKAFVQSKLGNYHGSIEMLKNAESIFGLANIQHISSDRVLILKAYIQHLNGNRSQALSTLEQIKQKGIYQQILELAIQYEYKAKNYQKQQQVVQLLNSKQQIIVKYCQKDKYSAFTYMILAIISQVNNKINQGELIQIFQKLKQSAYIIPSILYNTGIIYLKQNEQAAAVSMFNSYKQKFGIINQLKCEEIISYIYAVFKEYKKSIKIIKRNILLDPTNIRYRAQLFNTLQIKCLDQSKGPKPTRPEIFKNAQYLLRCKKFHQAITKVGCFQKHLQNFKQESLQQEKYNLSQIKNAAGVMEKQNEPILKYFEILRRDIMQRQGLSDHSIYKRKQTQVEEQEDEEDRKIRLLRQHKLAMIAKSKIQSEKMSKNWQFIDSKQKADQKPPNKRKLPPSQEGPSPTKKKKVPREISKDQLPTTNGNLKREDDAQDYYQPKTRSIKQGDRSNRDNQRNQQKSDNMKQEESEIKKYLV